jgi:hypothetical protein
MSTLVRNRITEEYKGDSKLLSGFPGPINGNPDNNLESPCKSILICEENTVNNSPEILLTNYS